MICSRAAFRSGPWQSAGTKTKLMPGLHRESDREANGLRFNGEVADPRARQLIKTRTTARHQLRPGNEATSWAKGIPPGPISALPRGNRALIAQSSHHVERIWRCCAADT